MGQPSPRADALRAMREARYDLNQKRMKEDQGRTVERPTVAAVNKKAAKQKPAKKSKRKIDRTRG